MIPSLSGRDAYLSAKFSTLLEPVGLNHMRAWDTGAWPLAGGEPFGVTAVKDLRERFMPGRDQSGCAAPAETPARQLITISDPGPDGTNPSPAASPWAFSKIYDVSPRKRARLPCGERKDPKQIA
jgi:hypothetical protein